MTKKTATGGQSLLINGALKMTRNKRAPRAATHQSNLTGANPMNISPNHHQQPQQQELALMNDTAREQLHAALGSRHHQQQHNQHHLINEGASTSSTESMSSFTGTSSPLHEDHQAMIIKPGGAHNAGGHHQAGPFANQSTFQSEQRQQRQQQQQQVQQHRQNLQSSINGKNKKLFPQKLWDLINDDRYNFCLRWSDDGQLVYLNRDEFEYSYLRTSDNQFHTQKAISFVRQMNMYGFRKVDDSYYENDNFRRGCKHLLKNMTRKHPNKASGGSTNPNNTAAVANGSMALNHRPELPNFTSYHKPMGGGNAGFANIGGAATLDQIASLFNGTVPDNSKMAHQHHQQQHQLHHHLSSIQSLPTGSQQPVDLRRAIAPTGCSGIGATTTAATATTVGNHLQPAIAAAHNGQDLNRLLESLVAMSQANMFENSLRNQQQELMEQQLQHRAQQANSEPMDLEQHVDIMNSPERTSHASMNESCSTAESLSPTIDPANIHINFNPNAFMNLLPPTQQEQPLSLVAPASTTSMPANREQDIFNALHLVRLMLQFMAQNPNPN